MAKTNNNSRHFAAFAFLGLLTVGIFAGAYSIYGFEVEDIDPPGRSGPFNSESRVFNFPVTEAEIEFDVISMPRSTYSDVDENGERLYEGSAIMSAWEGTRSSSSYINLAHTGYVDETTDTYLLTFFNQAQCIEDPENEGEFIPGEYIEVPFEAKFTKPDLIGPIDPENPPADGQPDTTIRAYDHFTVEWGQQELTVSINRYWRKVEEFPGGSALDYNILYPKEPQNQPDPYGTGPDIASPETAVSPPLEYVGRFAPETTRFTLGEPYETDRFARPASVLEGGQPNVDFKFYDLIMSVEGQEENPQDVRCLLYADKAFIEKPEYYGCPNNNGYVSAGDPQEAWRDPWPPVQYSIGSGAQWSIDNVNELRDSVSSMAEQAAPEPRNYLEASQYDPRFGEFFSVTALIRGFHSDPEDAYFGWCLDGVNQQGLLAGGEINTEKLENDPLPFKDIFRTEYVTDARGNTEEIQVFDRTIEVDEFGCCNRITRTPQEDVNGDGVDDEWQRRFYFKLAGTNDVVPGSPFDADSDGLLDANYDLDASAVRVSGNGAADPETVEGGEEDLDEEVEELVITGDGFIADQFQEIIGVDEELVTEENPFGLITERVAVNPGVIGIDGEEFVTGDGINTAKEEYIAGTDPTLYDTDFDGYSDEADRVGVGQGTLQFKSTKRPGEYPPEDAIFGNDRIFTRVRTVGQLPGRRSSLEFGSELEGEEREDTIKEFYSALERYVRVVQSDTFFYARREGELDLSLSYEPQLPGTQEEVVVRSNVPADAIFDGTLYYSWFFNRVVGPGNNPGTGEPDGDAPLFEGPSLDTLRFEINEVCPECQPGDQLQVNAEVVDQTLGASAGAQTTIEIGSDNSLLFYQDCNQDGADEEVGGDDYCFLSDQVTQDVPVIAEAQFFDVATNPNEFYFEWYLDHVLQTSNCLPPSGTTVSTPERCGLGTTRMVFTPQDPRTVHEIQVRVYRNEREVIDEEDNSQVPDSLVMDLTAALSVGNPSVTITFEPDATVGLDGYNISQPVVARANVEFVDPTPQGSIAAPDDEATSQSLLYTWKDSRGNLIKTETLASISDSVVDIDVSTVGTVELTVDVTSPDLVSPTNPEAFLTLTDGGQVYFTDGSTPEITALDQLRRQFASVASFIPAPMRSVLALFSVFLLVLGSVFGLMHVLRTKSQKSVESSKNQ